jgi:hypothetical protein
MPEIWVVGQSEHGGLVALFTPGSTKCSICGQVIHDGEEMTGLHHFISDRDDPLWRFSDSCVHVACFDGWPLRADWDAKYTQYRDKNGEYNMRVYGVDTAYPATDSD